MSDKIMLNRRGFLAAGASGLAALGLAACGGNSSSAASSSSAKEEAATPATTGTAADAASAELDTAAFDKLVAEGPRASDQDIAASTWATKVKQAGKLRVGGVKTSALFSQLNEKDNHMRGFDAGLYQLLANYILGDPEKYEMTLVQSSTRESVLQSDQVDAVFATYSITDERKKLISFAGPYYTVKQGILVKESNTDINGVADLEGKIVGTQQGSTGKATVEKYAPKATVQELGTDEELRTALEQGRIDAYVVDATLHMSSIISNPGKYRLAAEFGDDDPLGIGLPLDSDGVAFVNGFLEAIEAGTIWTDLWKICIGNRAGITEVPNPPAINKA